MEHLLPWRILQLSLLAIGVILIVLGVIHGEALLILKKAVLVCMECIGIG
jgi:hypothetical protein